MWIIVDRTCTAGHFLYTELWCKMMKKVFVVDVMNGWRWKTGLLRQGEKINRCCWIRVEREMISRYLNQRFKDRNWERREKSKKSGRQRIGGLKRGPKRGGYASGAWKRPGDLLIEQSLQAASLDRGSWYYRTHAVISSTLLHLYSQTSCII